ncbi:MAG: lysylphosphatidylglycerol synthase transmembrane domain-containing protein [Nanoarchaeota archaeon]
MKMKKTLRLLFGLAIIALLFWQIGVNDILSSLADLNASYLPVMIIIYLLIIFLGSMNVLVLLSPLKKRVRIADLVRMYAQTWAISSFMPGRLGDFSLAYFLKDKGVSVGESTSLVIVDKMLSVFVVFSLAIIAALRYSSGQSALIVAGTLITCIAGAIVIINSKPARHMVKKYILRKHSTLFKGFHKSFTTYRKRRGVLLVNAGLTLLRTCLATILIITIFHALGTSINFLDTLLINAVVMMVRLIPITLNGLGTMEASSVYLFGQVLGVPAGIVAGYAAVNLLLKYGLALCIFFFAGKRDKIKNS